MKTNAQARILFSELDGFGAGRLIHHEAGGSENAFPVGANDGLVDRRREAEVIRVDDKPAMSGGSPGGLRSTLRPRRVQARSIRRCHSWGWWRRTRNRTRNGR